MALAPPEAGARAGSAWVDSGMWCRPRCGSLRDQDKHSHTRTSTHTPLTKNRDKLLSNGS